MAGDDLGFVPAADQPPAEASAAPAAASSPAASTPPSDDLGFVPQSPADALQEKYGTPGEMWKTGVEGFRKGILGPVAALQDKYMPDTGGEEGQQEEANRAAANPITAGVVQAAGLGAGFLTGTGVGGVAGAAGQGVEDLLGATSMAGKIGSAAIRGAVENGLIQAGEETSKYILGQEDPETPVASALSNIGYAGLIGTGVGGGLGIVGQGAVKGFKALSDSRAAVGASQLLQDFGSRWNFRHANPDMVSTVANELRDFYGSTNAARDDVYGASGLKAQAIDKLTQDVTPQQLSNHVDEVSKVLDRMPTSGAKGTLFQDAIDAWKNKVTPQIDPISHQPTYIPTAADTFTATDTLKRQFQEFSKYNKTFTPISEQPFRNASMSAASALRKSLEDPSNWNQAGTFQAGLNKAVSGMIGPNDSFLSKFADKVKGEETPLISPGKIQTYINQLGDPKAEIKATELRRYVEAAENFRGQINDLHATLGLESPLQATPLTAVKSTYGAETAGGKWADKLFDTGVNNFAGKTTQTLLGATVGHEAAGITGALSGAVIGHFAPYIEEAIGRHIRDAAVPSILRALQVGKPAAITDAIEHAGNVAQGQAAMKRAVNAVFTAGKVGAAEFSAAASNRDKDKIRKFVEQGGAGQQIKNQINLDNAPQAAQPAPSQQNFARGGEVKAPVQVPIDNSQRPDHFGDVFPTQNIMMNAAKGRVYNYLNGIRPQPDQAKLPFDAKMPDKQKERDYDRAVNLAASPLSVTHSIMDGSLNMKDMVHFKTMWPEVHNQLSKQMCEKISQAQLKGEKPPYKVRQALSLFLGSSLDTTFTPAAMQAIQGTYMVQQSPQQPSGVTKNKRNTSSLQKAPDQYQTTGQAAEARQRKS